MKYVITGGAGHISKPLVKKLLNAGHQVTVIGRNAANLEELTKAGAAAAIGSVEDVEFLQRTFTGADAVYTMVPPNFAASPWKEYIAGIGKNYTEAIKATGVRYVVNLSSIGAHLPDNTGPITGLHRGEQSLNTLADTNIKHLRPAYFYTNLLSNTGMVKQLGIIGANFGGDQKLVIVHPEDIADTAFEELNKLDFAGHSVRYVVSDERTTSDIAAVLGKAIGKPELPWIVFSDEQAYDGMIQAGLPAEIAKNYVEMGTAFRSGVASEDYWKNHPAQLGKIKLEDFAADFAKAYNS